MTPKCPALSKLPLQILAWGLLLLLACAALAAWRYHALAGALGQESSVLQRLASQRAGQHDAHLTALSAIAAASDDEKHGLFLDVAATITRFYPRIDDIQLVPLNPRLAPAGIGPLSADLAQLVRSAAGKSDGEVALLPYPGRADHYMMVKRSPNTEHARYGLMLSISAPELIGEAGPFWSQAGAALRLSMQNGHVLVDQGSLPASIQYSGILTSASQPLVLETGMAIGVGDLLPPIPTAIVLALASLLYFAALAAWRQRLRTRAAVEQARLSALESRLAHASRVNALGEMASGLAHELTQPLTAILAQAQASRRLLDRSDSQALGPVLEETVSQAKRASAILERFRNWSRPQRKNTSVFDLRTTLDNVEALLAPQAASRGVRLGFDTPASAVFVKADSVEMEQVVFNLVRNALEAVDRQGDAWVRVVLKQEGPDVLLDVIDNGPGVPPDLRARLFTPFTTSRPDGTGLGLALSQRLVERAGGDIFLADEGPGATFRIVLKQENILTEAAE